MRKRAAGVGAEEKEAAPKKRQTKRPYRHKAYETEEEVREVLESYFDGCDASGTLYSEAGMALALGVSMPALRSWFDGTRRAELQSVVQWAYLRVLEQVQTDPRYREKGGMTSIAIFMMKQPRFAGYQDRIEAKQDLTVNVKIGGSVEESDFL